MLARLFIALLLLTSTAWADTWPMGRYGGTPTCTVTVGAGSCAVTSSSFDSGGEITLAGVIGAVRLNFSTTYSPALRCNWTVYGIALPAITFGLPSGTAVLITATLTGATLHYACWTP